MLENGRINRFQLWLLLINFIIGSALIFIPSKVITIAKQDAWITMLLVILVGSLFIILITSLSKIYFGKTIVEINKEVLGKKLGMIVSLLYVWYFIHLSSILLREMGDIIKVITLNETPILVIHFLICVLIFYGVYYGLETIARANELYSMVAFIGFLFTILLLTPLMELDRIKPVLYDGPKPVIEGIFPAIGFTFGEMAIFLMIIPFVNEKRHLTKILIGSGVIGGLTLFMIVLASILVVDVTEAALSIFAPLTIARLINIGDFLTRVEIIFNFTYFTTVYMKMCLTFYAGVLAFSESFKLSFYRPVIIPMLIIVISLSIIISDSIVEFLDYTGSSWLPYTLVFSLVIPVILLIITFIKKKKKSSKK